ncbi:uncharacterized protein LOC144164271 [Haemaphysalis longicornis]
MAERRVCVVILETGEKKKVVLETGSHAELFGTIAVLTAITDNTLVQMYDPELDEFIDLEPNDEVPNKAKIKISRKMTPAANSESRFFSSKIEISLLQQLLPNLIQLSHPLITDFNAVFTFYSANSALGAVKKVPLQDKQDYLKFILPSFEPYESVLKRKTPISRPLTHFIVNKLFQTCYDIVVYPSHNLYRVAVEGLVAKYPHLLDHVDGTSGVGSWITSLRNKFKNVRKATENCSAEMIAMRQKHTLPKRQASSDAGQPNKKLCRLADYSHLVVYGETAESLRSHVEWLHENAHCTVDDEALRARLQATSKARHEKLKELSIEDALTEFPFLFNEASLLMEFNIVFKKDIVETMEAGFRKLCELVIRCGTEKEVGALSAAAGVEELKLMR